MDSNSRLQGAECEKQIERDRSLPEGRRANVCQGPISWVVKRGKSGCEEGTDVIEGGCRVKVGPCGGLVGGGKTRGSRHAPEETFRVWSPVFGVESVDNVTSGEGKG